MTVLSYILSILGLVCMIIASLSKGDKMKTILILVCLGNVLPATSYLLTSGINGAAACYLGALQALINYFFYSQNRALPKWLIVTYAAAIVVLNIAVAGGITPLGVLVIVASLTFIMCIGQTSGAKYRFWTIFNLLLWIVYDAFSASYGNLYMTHTPLLIFTVAGMIIHDRKKA